MKGWKITIGKKSNHDQGICVLVFKIFIDLSKRVMNWIKDFCWSYVFKDKIHSTHNDFSVKNPVLCDFWVAENGPSEVVSVAIVTQGAAGDVGTIWLTWKKTNLHIVKHTENYIILTL